MQHKTKVIYMLLPLLLLLLASCGSDDNDEPETKPIPTHIEILKFDNNGGTGEMRLNEAYPHYRIESVITKIEGAGQENIMTYDYSGSGDTFGFSVDAGFCRLVKSPYSDVVTVEVDRNDTGLNRYVVVFFNQVTGVGNATILGIQQTP